MLLQAETQFGRKLNGDEVTLVTGAFQRGMTVGQMIEALNASETQETPQPRPPRTYRFEGIGKQVQSIGVSEDG